MEKPSLEGVELKIERAKRHLSDLKKAVKRVLDPERYIFRKEIDSETGKHMLWIDPIPCIVPEWSIIIGEILFNLRSALDHLAYQLMILDGRSPTCKTQFPIRDSACNKDGKLMPLKGWLMPEIKSKKILTTLNECQPYQGNGLFNLKTLNNIDKHRLLLVVVCILDTDEMWFDSPETAAPKVSIYTGPFKEGLPIGCFDFHGKQAPPDFNPHPALSIALDEPEAAIIRGEPFDVILGELCSLIENDIVAQRFGPMFS
jgi:hypothetical protein